MKTKVYLDFQIIDKCSKDDRYKKFFLEDIENDYYLSVNHFEELYRAKKNAEFDTDKICADKLYNILFMIYEMNKVIINPDDEKGVIFKSESFIDCY